MRRGIFLEQSQEGIAVLRQDGSLVEWNPAFAQMLGYSEQEMSHLNVKDWDSKLKKMRRLMISPIPLGWGIFRLKHNIDGKMVAITKLKSISRR